MTDERKEQVKLETELLRFLGLLFLASAGGTAALVATPDPSGRQVALAVLGVVVSIGLAIGAGFLYNRILGHITNPEEKA
jgi:hypothetical protein